MSEPELTIEEVLRRAGGPVLISRYLAERGRFVSPSAISRWRYTVSGIPQKYWGYIIEMTEGLAPVTAQDMLKIHNRADASARQSKRDIKSGDSPAG